MILVMAIIVVALTLAGSLQVLGALQAGSYKTELGLTWRVFLEVSVCCRGVPLYVSAGSGTVGVLVYYQGNSTTILYIININNNKIFKYKFKSYKPAYINYESGYYDTILYDEQGRVKELIYTPNNNSISITPGFTLNLGAPTIINGVIVQHNTYYFYGSKIIKNMGMVGFIAKVTPAGVVKQLQGYNNSGPLSSIIDAALDKQNDTIYAIIVPTGKTGAHPELLEINANSLEVERNSTLEAPLIPTSIAVDGGDIIVSEANGNGSTLQIYSKQNLSIIKHIYIENIFIKHILYYKNYIILGGSYENRTTDTLQGLISALAMPTLKPKGTLLVTGRGNVDITAMAKSNIGIIIGGTQNDIPYAAIVSVKQVAIPEQNNSTTKIIKNNNNNLKIVIILIIIIVTLALYIRNTLSKRNNKPGTHNEGGKEAKQAGPK